MKNKYLKHISKLINKYNNTFIDNKNKKQTLYLKFTDVNSKRMRLGVWVSHIL